MNRRTLRTAFFFTLLVFSVMLISLTIIFMLAIVGFKRDWFRPDNYISLTVIFSVISIVICTILARILGRKTLDTITKISDASKRVAKGDFELQIDNLSTIEEISTLTENFNLMIRELSNTEMFRNDFIENVSHEFKTPLSSIEGYATLLQSKNLSEEKKKEYTCKILESTKRLSSLTGNILLLSRLENQEIEVKKEPFSLDEQLRQTILMYEETWNSKNISLDIELDEVSYSGNPELLFQVWQNIFGNAVKFTNENGNIKISLSRSEGGVCVNIKDNGIGMNSDTMQRIYEKFYQGDTSRSRSGNGLGMTLSKRIIDLHEGEILISSSEGHGSSFSVILPD